jgi:adenosylhomocysteine nucleosidase
VITGIVVALPEELSTLSAKKCSKGSCLFMSDAIAVAYSGAGAGNASTAAQLLITQGATRLISWGCAAALSDHLKPGDLVLPDSLIDVDGAQIKPHADWHKHTQDLLTKAIKVHTGSLTESHSIVESSQDKKNLYLQTGAIALDMESIAIAKIARQHDLPFIAIRAIADPATMDLPRAIKYSLNEFGDIDLTKLLAFIAMHPFEIPGLIKLGLHFQAAKNTLKWVAKQSDQI